MPRSVLLEFRRDTAANWTAANPTLASGEPGWETDTNKLKIGDGATAWNALGYFGGAAVSPLTTKGDVWGYSTTDARVPVGANGQVLTADSAQALSVKWQTPGAGTAGVVVLDSGSFTGGTVSTSNNTDATAVTVCSTAGHTYDGATAIIVECFAPATDTAASAGTGIICTVWEDATDLGRYWITRAPTANVLRGGIHFETLSRTPSAGAHTYTFKFFSTNAGITGIVYGGAGGAGVNAPAFIRVLQAY